MNTENPFVKHSAHNQEKLAKAKEFLTEIVDMITSAYCNINIRVKNEQDKTIIKVVRQGIRESCYHSFTCGEDGIIHFSSYKVLLFASHKTEGPLAKRLLKKYPDSRYSPDCGGSDFTLNLTIKDEKDFYKKAKDIASIFEKDSFSLNR